MKEVISFVMKGILKSKYILLVPFIIILFIVSLMTINSNESGTTQQELQDTFNDRKETINFIIGSLLNKKKDLGLPEEQQLALDSLLLQEVYLKEISTKLARGDLDISNENLAYLKAYSEYESYDFISYINPQVLKVEQQKAAALSKQGLPFTEQETPFNTALFSKQLFQLLFSPFTAFLFFLIFIYKIISDEQNRTFEFFKVNSLSNTAIYYGYLIPFLMLVIVYTILAAFFTLLPPLLTGNLETIHYPIDMLINTETVMVPVWKWLLFLPIGWAIFVALMLTIAICLFKQRLSFSVLLAIIAVPVVCGYIYSVLFGFHMFNPIHLIVSYEMHLLPTNRFVTYLTGMLLLLILCLLACFPVFKSKNVVFTSPLPAYARKRFYPKLEGRMQLLQFEHIKKKRKGHVLLTIILLTGIIGSTFIIVNQTYQKLPTIYLNVMEDLQNLLIEEQVQWKVHEEDFNREVEANRISEDSGDGTTDFPEENPFTMMIRHAENEYNVLDELKYNIGSKDFAQKYNEITKPDQSYRELDSTMWNVTVMASEEQQHILDKKNITPWPIGYQWISHFNDPSYALGNEHYTLLKSSQERNTKYGNSSLFTMYKFLDWNIMLVVLCVFILLLWTCLSVEQRPTSSIHFLTTKPLTFQSIYASKWIYNLLIAYGAILISGGITFIVSSIIGGFGEPDYPILVYALENTNQNTFFSPVENSYFYFESLLVLLVKSGFLIVAQIFFLNSLFSLIGRWIKNYYVSLVITLLVSVLGYYFANQYITTSFMYLNPFVYFDTWNIVDGWKSVLASSSAVNFRNGSMILLLSGLSLFLIGFIPRRKRVS